MRRGAAIALGISRNHWSRAAMTKQSQCDQVLEVLKQRPLTTAQIHNLKILRPAVVIERLRDGNTKRKPVKIHTQPIGFAQMARYWLYPMWLENLGKNADTAKKRSR